MPRRPTRYKSIISIQALSNGATSVILSSNPNSLNQQNPQGYTVSVAPHIFQWETQQPLYAIAIGGGPTNVSVIDQVASAVASKAEEDVQYISEAEELEGEGGRGPSYQ